MTRVSLHFSARMLNFGRLDIFRHSAEFAVFWFCVGLSLKGKLHLPSFIFLLFPSVLALLELSVESPCQARLCDEPPGGSVRPQVRPHGSFHHSLTPTGGPWEARCWAGLGWETLQKRPWTWSRMRGTCERRGIEATHPPTHVYGRWWVGPNPEWGSGEESVEGLHLIRGEK